MARAFRFTNNPSTNPPSKSGEHLQIDNEEIVSSLAAPTSPHGLSIEELNQFFYDAENISNIVEVILRGKINSIDLPKLMETMDSMYLFLSKRVQSEALEMLISDTNKTKYLEIGVKLHNKSRNLVANQYLEIRTLIRVICAWIFIHFGERTSKVYLIIVKLFAKTGYDFHYHLLKDSCNEETNLFPCSVTARQRKTLSRAFDCYGVVITLYDNSEELDIYHRLPPLEIQEVRMAVFRCLLGSMQILHQLGGYPDIADSLDEITTHEKQVRESTLQKELQRRIQLARSMVPSLHLRYRISLVELLFEITNKIISSDGQLVDEPFQYYTMSLDFLEIPNDKAPGSLDANLGKGVVLDSEEDLALQRRKRELEIRCYLALAMIHAEKSETAKARFCLESAENYSFHPVDLKASFHLVKFTIFLKEGNIDFAEGCLKDYVLNADCDFDEIRNMLDQWIDFMSRSQTTNLESSSPLSVKVTEMFKLFAGRFQSDPEYTKIRIAHLQAMLHVSNIYGDDDKPAHKIYEIAGRIVADHCLSIHKLSGEMLRVMRSLLLHQVKQYYDLHFWNAAKIWSELAYKLLDCTITESTGTSTASENIKDGNSTVQDDLDLIVAVLGAKVEALINLQQFSDAIDVAQMALNKRYCSRSVVTFFKALIFFESIPPSNIIERLATILEKHPPGLTKARIAITTEETFEQLFMCLSTCNQSLAQSSRKSKIMILLLRYWVKLYCDLKPWKHEALPSATTEMAMKANFNEEIDNRSFLSVCCHYFSFALSDFTYIEARNPTLLLLDFKRIFDENQPFAIPVSSETISSLEENNLPRKRAIGSDHDYNSTNSIILDSLSDLYKSLLLVYSTVEEALKTFPMRLLGKVASLEWLGNTSASVGTRLINYHKYMVNIHGRSVGNLSSEEIRERETILRLAADYLTTTEAIFALLSQSRPLILKDRIRFLVLASAARLDYIELIGGDNRKNQTTTSISLVRQSISPETNPQYSSPSLLELGRRALDLAEKAVSLISQEIDFADEEDKDLLSNALILQFASYNFIGESDQSESFVAATLDNLNAMNFSKLQVLVEIVEQSRSFSLDAFRLLLDNAIQTIKREITRSKNSSEKTNDQALIGWMYRKLIELSPSRRYAIEKINEFEGLLKATVRSSGDHPVGANPETSISIVNHEDLDRIVAQSYNYSVTLIDLDQYSLAEQFLLKAQTLALYGSDTAKAWLPKMQKTHSHLQSLMKQETSITNQSHLSVLNNAMSSTSGTAGHPRDGNNSATVIDRLKSPELGKMTVSLDSLQQPEQ